MAKSGTKFSAVIITYNEEVNIGRCLEALRQVTDDIIVADSHSSDGTPEIVKRAGARLFSVDWQGYARTKNLANAEARHEWILSVDADEVLSDELIDTLQQWIAEADTVYAVDRLTNYCGTWIYHSGWYPEWKIRLFPRTSVNWQGDFVHETLRVPEHYTIQRIQGRLLHYSYRSQEDHKARIEKYARLWASERFENGRGVPLLKRWFGPIARLVTTYLLKQGWRDGRAGRLISYYESLMVRRRHEILDELRKGEPPSTRATP